MVRLAASLVGLVAFLALLVLPALAGDRAQISLIGYSADGSYFAFEEFGIQDGSGFAYSNIYLVNLVEDSWVIGTPIRVQSEDETTPLTEIRAQAQAKAADDIAMLAIDVPGEFVAMIGDGVPDADAQKLTFGVPGPASNAVTGSHTLTLSQFETRAAAPCVEWFSSPARGYQLSVKNYADDRVVHRDSSLPRSRGCPVDYRLFGVVMPFADTPLSHAVAIISVYTFGFEGPDRRFIAVPLGL